MSYSKPLFDLLKTKNDKLFNENDVSPIATFQLASVEAKCWKKGKFKEDKEDKMNPKPSCQIHVSCINHGSICGLGWSHMDQMRVERFGL